MDIIQAATKLRPGTHWNLRGNKLEQVEGEKRVSIPTLEELQAEMDKVSYRDLRAPLYPPKEEGLDGLVHKENGDSTKWVAYVAACLAVKAQFPKPEAQ